MLCRNASCDLGLCVVVAVSHSFTLGNFFIKPTRAAAACCWCCIGTLERHSAGKCT